MLSPSHFIFSVCWFRDLNFTLTLTENVDWKEKVQCHSCCAAHVGPMNSQLLLFGHSYKKLKTKDFNDIDSTCFSTCTKQYTQLSSCGQPTHSYPPSPYFFLLHCFGFATHLQPDFAVQCWIFSFCESSSQKKQIQVTY